MNGDTKMMGLLLDELGTVRIIRPPLDGVNKNLKTNQSLTFLVGHLLQDAASCLERSFAQVSYPKTSEIELHSLRDLILQYDLSEEPQACLRSQGPAPGWIHVQFSSENEEAPVAMIPIAWDSNCRIWAREIESSLPLTRMIVTQFRVDDSSVTWQAFLEGEVLGPSWSGASYDSLQLTAAYLPASIAGLDWPETICIQPLFDSSFDDVPTCLELAPQPLTPSQYPLHVRGNESLPLAPVQQLALVTCYFNPYQDPRILENYWKFKEALETKCYSVELSFQGEFETDADLKISGGSEHITWQKEALLNRLICQLPDSVDAVAWIDADVVFEDPSWRVQALQLLQTHEAVQLFSTAIFLDQHQEVQRVGRGMSAGYDLQCGLAWAARCDYLRRIGGLYPYIASGANDVIWAEAVFGIREPVRDYITGEAFHPDYLRSIHKWKSQATRSLRSTAVNLPGTIRHLYHRSRSNGKYQEASLLLSSHQYSPWRDVEFNQDGILQWTGNNQPLQQEIQQWFQQRKQAL